MAKIATVELDGQKLPALLEEQKSALSVSNRVTEPPCLGSLRF